MPANDKLNDLHDRLLAQVEALVDSEDWRGLLALAARFHRYSINNLLLILSQRPDATRVAGYRRWQSLGRQVRRGEAGIAILAPCVYRARSLDEQDPSESTDVACRLTGFRLAHVWDISQTDGDPLPEVLPTLLEGEAPPALWEALADHVREAGFELRRGDCGGANGRTDYLTRTVTVREDVDEAQAAKTLAHELAHVWLHDPATGSHHRGIAEVEAESMAYIVCHATGLATDDYSLPYVARWASGAAAALRLTAERVVSAARRALASAGVVDLDARVGDAMIPATPGTTSRAPTTSRAASPVTRAGTGPHLG